MFVDLSIAFDSMHWGKIEEIVRAYGLPKEIVNTVMVLHQSMKMIVCTFDGGTILDTVALLNLNHKEIHLHYFSL